MQYIFFTSVWVLFILNLFKFNTGHNALVIRAKGLFTTDPVAVNVNVSNDVCVNAILKPDIVPVIRAKGLCSVG